MKNFIFVPDFPGEKQNKEGIVRALYSVLGGEIPVFACIGTDAVAGDSIGPLTGSLLKKKLRGASYVYGTLDHPITAKDSDALSVFLNHVHPYAKVLAIDAALGERSEIGKIRLTDRPLFPGLGVSKNLMPVGCASLIAVMEEKRANGSSFLRLVRFSRVYAVAEFLSGALSTYVESVLSGRVMYRPEIKQTIV